MLLGYTASSCSGYAFWLGGLGAVLRIGWGYDITFLPGWEQARLQGCQGSSLEDPNKAHLHPRLFGHGLQVSKANAWE